MFEGVSADDVAEVVDGAVSCFEDFGEGIEADGSHEVTAASVFRFEHQEREQNDQDREKLDAEIEAQIAGSAELARVPKKNATCADKK